VLAEPTVDLAGKTWARLTDGTPLVTAEKRGKGWLVLVHTTSDPEWSNLAISGLFVNMLRRIVALSQGVSGNSDTALPPVETLDGFGRLQRAPSSVQTIAAGAFADTVASPSHPPGFYGTADARRALNLAGAVKRFAAIGELPAGVARESRKRLGSMKGAAQLMQPGAAHAPDLPDVTAGPGVSLVPMVGPLHLCALRDGRSLVQLPPAALAGEELPDRVHHAPARVARERRPRVRPVLDAVAPASHQVDRGAEGGRARVRDGLPEMAEHRHRARRGDEAVDDIAGAAGGGAADDQDGPARRRHGRVAKCDGHVRDPARRAARQLDCQLVIQCLAKQRPPHG